jgi:hypothetical protein
MSTRTQSAIMREVGTSAAGTERVDAGKWVPSTHGGVGSEDAEGGFALRVAIRTKFSGADRALQPGMGQGDGCRQSEIRTRRGTCSLTARSLAC